MRLHEDWVTYDERRSYRTAPARDAWARTLAFFARHLAA